MRLRTVAATRYVTPLREGGSVPAIIEADDCGTYVLKFRGAAQGAKALVAELVAGEVARALGLPIPELVLVELDPVLGRSEPDPELRAPLRASGGLNIGLDYLPGSIAFDPALAVSSLSGLAARIVWFDALIANVDRSVRNPNLLLWHKELYLIDHGAALYFHHDWATFSSHSGDRFQRTRDHVLLPFARDLAEADAQLAPLLSRDRVREILAAVPDSWLASDGPPEDARAIYVDWLWQRLNAPRGFAEEAAHAYAQLV
ncbi:MAG: aminotransferase class [Myxococcales bacterium]|nr:aminotransferase class [Myxococcales bacterium]